MKRENVLYVLGTLSLLFAIGVAVYVSPGLRDRLPFLKGSALETSTQVEPVLSGQNAAYYQERRAEIREKINALGDAPADETRRRLEEELTRANLCMALADDADFSERYQSLEICAQTFQLNGDVENLEILKKELLAKDWDEREQFRLVHLANSYLLRTKIARAIRQENREAVENLVPELEDIAIEDGESVDAIVSKNVASFVDPIAAYDKALGDEAKRTMRKGFYRSKRRSSDKALRVEYEPEKTSVALSDGEELVYDKTLLNVPKDEELQFYLRRIEDLKNLLLRVPDDANSEALQTLRANVRRATFDAYELLPCAVDLAPFVASSNPQANAARNQYLADSCKVLANAGEVERLERLAAREEFRDVVGSFLFQARAAKATESNAPEDADAALDEALQWSLDASNDAEVVARLGDVFKELENAAVTDEKKTALTAAKKKFRDAFRSAEKPSKRRLAYIDALQDKPR